MKLKGVYQMRITTVCPECGEEHTMTVSPDKFNLGIGYLCSTCSAIFEHMEEESNATNHLMAMVADAARSVGPVIHVAAEAS